MSSPVSYRLAPPVPLSTPPRLDEHQQLVVDHEGGPLLVLAGPGTGKTTTLVAAVADRVERRGARPDQVLALTFSRKAAEQLRDRVTARLGRTTSTAISSTFHSFAYGLIKRHQPADLYASALRLLSAPEQDVVVHELLADAPESVQWPARLDVARRTRGFAREVADVLARAREKDHEGADLVALGVQEDVPEFVAAGHFLEQYLTVLDQQGAIDYPDLVRRAVLVAQRHAPALRDEFRHVFVDEYQDTDPGQVALLQALAGGGGNLTVVGDPHQSIYGFRGAEVRGILDFPAEFRHLDGRAGDVVALRSSRRFGPRLLRASQSVASRLSLAGSIPAQARDAFLHPVPGEGAPRGRVEVVTFDTERAEAEHLADLLRRAHLEDGVPWSEMALLVRSGQASIPTLRRSLVAHGVPVEVAGDETSLVREPAARPLLDALEAVLNLTNDVEGSPGHIDPQRAHGLLTSQLGGLDAADLRALSRSLRAKEKMAAAEEGRAARPSSELLRAAVTDPALLLGLDGHAAHRASEFVGLLHRVHAQRAEGATAEALLWALWDGTSWPRRLRAAVDHGGAAARMAHRDLDVVCALFDTAAKSQEKQAHTSAENFLAGLAAQEIPADTLADRGVRGEAVRILTAHRSKGLEWDLVVVAHVQEERWPDLRQRSSLLKPDRIGTHGLQEPRSRSELLAEERRLFYVACTRARTRLVVTAVASPEDDGEQASRFLHELGTDVLHRSGRPPRPLSVHGLVAELRRTVADPEVSAGLRAAAARRLARLAVEQVGAQPIAPAAHPDNWWGTRALSSNDVPLRATDRPVPLSASSVSALLTCPAQWFLAREAGGASASTSAQGFGLVVHAIAERIGRGELSGEAAEIGSLMELVDQVWGQLQFRTPWSATREREAVEAALSRFLDWHGAPGARTLLATEQELKVVVTLPDGEQAHLRGYMDRLELDEAGRVVVVDLKTGKGKPTAAEVAVHPQLALYQYAVANGAVDHLVPSPPAEAGGAELVHLRLEARGKVAVQHQAPAEPTDDGTPLPVEEQLMTAARALRTEEFPAVKGDHCKFCDFHAICPAQRAGTVLS